MRKNILFLTITLSLIVQMQLGAQHPYYAPYDEDTYEPEIIVQHDTIIILDTLYVSELNHITRIFGMTFDEYSKQLLKTVAQGDTTHRQSLERLYLNYLLPMYYPSYIRHRFIVRNYSVEVIDNQLKMHVDYLSKPFIAYQDSLDKDVMLMCRGDVNTDHFLRSPQYRASCLEQLFLSINKAEVTKIQGINLYFPDFSFKEKRALAQFIKSASLVIDSCNVKSMRNLRLYATFDKDNGKKNYAYLLGLTQMVDSVLLVNTKSMDWPRDSILSVSKTNAVKASWWSKIKNQFYLARFHLEPFPNKLDQGEELSPQHVRQLIHTDYPYNNWEVYLFILIAVCLGIIIVCFLYRFNVHFSYFANNNLTYIFSLIIIFVLEIYLLFMCMVEAMSNEHVFTLGSESKNAILLFPLLFIFIFPMLNWLSRKGEKP